MTTQTTTTVELNEIDRLYELCAKGMVVATKKNDMAFSMELKDGLKQMLAEAGHEFDFRKLLDLCCEFEAQA